MKYPFIAAFFPVILPLLPTTAEALTVDTGGTADVGTYAAQSIVAGNPAIAYKDETNSALKFVRASDVSGSAWPAPVIVDSTGFVGTWLSLAIVNGNPPSAILITVSRL